MSTLPSDPGASRALPRLVRLVRFLVRLLTPGNRGAGAPPAAPPGAEHGDGDAPVEDAAPQELIGLPPPRASRVGAPQPRTVRAQQAIGPLSGSLVPAQPFAGRPTGLWFLAGQPSEPGAAPPVDSEGLLVAGSLARPRRVERFEPWRNPSLTTPARHPDTGLPLPRARRGREPVVTVSEPVATGRPPLGPLLPDPPDLDSYSPTARGLVPPVPSAPPWCP